MCVPLSCTDENNKERQIGIPGLPLKISVSNALANKENEIFTLNASPLEKSCSRNAQKNSSTDLKMVALKSAENQPQVLEDVLFPLTLSDESLLKSKVCSVKPNKTSKSICALVNVSVLLSTRTVKWRNNAVAAPLPRLSSDKFLLN